MSSGSCWHVRLTSNVRATRRFHLRHPRHRQPRTTRWRKSRSPMSVDRQETVSVVVTTRNSAHTLEACLKSVRDQDYPATELVVVDNHSTDATLEIARRYAHRVAT